MAGDEAAQARKRRRIDLRSDTVTQPTAEMREAMFKAEVGDAVYEEDPAINAFEALMAKESGMEAALWCTSGTQSNLVALMGHCGRGDEVIIGSHGHSFYYEGGGAAVLGSMSLYPLPQDPVTGCMSLEDIRAAIRPDNLHFPRTRCITIENTHNGIAIPEEHFKQVRALVEEECGEGGCSAHRIVLHCDGARIVNAMTKFGVPLRTFTQHLDSISICFSKGLGAPVGSVLCGSRQLINEAKRHRKALGGGVRQGGFLAAACTFAWEQHRGRLAEDHANCRHLAELLRADDVCRRFLDEVHYNEETATNMVYVKVAFGKLSGGDASKGKGAVVDAFDAFMKSRDVVIGSPKYTQGKRWRRFRWSPGWRIWIDGARDDRSPVLTDVFA